MNLFNLIFLCALMLNHIAALPRRVKKTEKDDPLAIPIDFSANRTPVRTSVIYSEEERSCFRNETVFYKGSCESLLERGQCGDGEWLILDERSMPGIRPVCQKMRCTSDEVFWPEYDKCVQDSSSLCTKKGTTLKSDVFGIGSCECKNDAPRVKHLNGVCYKLYSRGPCEKGFVYVYDDESGQYLCQEDRCAGSADNSENVTRVFWEPTRTCYDISTRGPCKGGATLELMIHKKKPSCELLMVSNLFQVPSNCNTDLQGSCVKGVKLQTGSDEFVAALLQAGDRRKKRN